MPSWSSPKLSEIKGLHFRGLEVYGFGALGFRASTFFTAWGFVVYLACSRTRVPALDFRAPGSGFSVGVMQE